MGIFGAGLLVTAFMGLFGDWLFNIYLGQQLAPLVSPIQVVFGLWLSLAGFQHMASSHFVLKGCNSQALYLNLVMLGLVAVLGWEFAKYEPIYWIYGALTSQIIPLGVMLKLWWRDSSQRPWND